MAILVGSSEVKRLQEIIELSKDFIPPRGLVVFSNPERKTKIIVFSCGLFRWQRLNHEGQIVDYAGLTPAGVIMRYGYQQTCMSLIEAFVKAFAKAIDRGFYELEASPCTQ
jgi:hypothetical protein